MRSSTLRYVMRVIWSHNPGYSRHGSDSTSFNAACQLKYGGCPYVSLKGEKGVRVQIFGVDLSFFIFENVNVNKSRYPASKYSYGNKQCADIRDIFKFIGKDTIGHC